MKQLTENEKTILDASVIVWNAYMRCDSQHPDEIETMRKAIHQIQDVIAVRLAQRTFPDIFPIKK